QVEAVVLGKAAGQTIARLRAALARAVTRIDPAGAADRADQARRDVALIRTHYGDGIASIFARMPAEDADLIWTAADTWARRAKAGGDQRSLDQLRVAYLIRSATSYLTHADPTHCDRTCQASPAS